MIRKQKEEALRDHEKRLFEACNAAAKTEFFTANVSPSDAVRDQLERDRGTVRWCGVVCCGVV